MPSTNHPTPEERARVILDPALASRERLEFVLALSHELRTPVGIITGYTSLAREGQVTAEEALDVVDFHAGELSALLELMLAAAVSAVEDPSEGWDEPVREALVHAARVNASLGTVFDRARRGGRRSGPGRRSTRERRDTVARAARDELASLTRIHPREVGGLSLEVVSRLLEALESRPSNRTAGA